MSVTDAAVAPTPDTEPAPPAPVDGARRTRRRHLLHESVWTLGVAAAAVALAMLWFRVWSTPMRIPFVYWGDGLFHTALVKGLIEQGTPLENPALGAPFGQELYDFPLGTDGLHVVMLRVLGAVLGDAALTINTYFLLTFGLIAASGFVVARRLRVPRSIAAAIAIVFAFAPYHFARGISHLFLASYFAVPFVVLLAVRVASPTPRFFFRAADPAAGAAPLDRGGVVRDRWRRFGLPVVWCAFLAVSNPYYAAFALVLVGTMGVLASLRDRSLKPVICAGVLAVLIAGSMVAANAPTLLNDRAEGPNPTARSRAVSDVDAFGLRVVQLFVPRSEHRFPPFRVVHEEFERWNGLQWETITVGLVAGAGLLGGLVFAVVQLIGARRRTGDGRAPPLEGRLAAIAIAAVLVASVGGLAWILSLAGLEEIRSWGRMSIVLAWCGLLFAARALQRGRVALRRRVTDARRARAVTTVALVALVALALWDQLPPRARPDLPATQAEFDSDRAIVRQIEATLPSGAAVFQMPSIPFPEYPDVLGIRPYDHLRPYLHSDSLRWSYAGMKGRESDWQDRLADLPLDGQLRAIAAAGFDGLWVDLAGYPPDEAERLRVELPEILGVDAITSPNGRIAFFDLRPFAAALRDELGPDGFAALRDEVLTPPLVSFPPIDPDGCYPAEATPTEVFRWCRARTGFDVREHDDEQPATLRFRVRSAAAGEWSLRVQVGDVDRTVEIGPGWRTVEVPVDIGPERTTVQLTTDAPRSVPVGEPRDLRFALADVAVADGSG